MDFLVTVNPKSCAFGTLDDDVVQYRASVRCKFQFQVTQIDSVVVAEFFWLIAVNSFNSFDEPRDNSMLSIVVKKRYP